MMKIIEINDYLINHRKIDIRENMLSDLLENFNFLKVKSVMEYLNWTWVFSNGVPTIDEMKLLVTNFFNELYDRTLSPNDYNSISTGGFKVTRNQIDETNFYIEVEFILTEWMTENNNLELQVEYNDEYQ